MPLGSARMSRDSATSNSVTSPNSIYKTPPVKIGAGLSRSKLITGGTLGAKPPSIKLSSALKSPTRIGISGSGLTPVSRANSERYQSSYTRFETLQNASFPALSDGDISDKTGTEAESSKPVRHVEKNGSAKRASYPSFSSPIIGSSSTYIEMQGQYGALKSQYSESPIAANSVANKVAGRRGHSIHADLDKPGKELAKHQIDTKAPSALSRVKDIVEVELPARPKTERIHVPYDGRNIQLQANAGLLTKGDGLKQESEPIKTITETSTKPPNAINDLSVQKVESVSPEKNDAVQNFVAPPRRRRAKSRDLLNSSNEARTVDTPRTTGSNKPQAETEIGLLGTVTPPGPVSSVTSPDIAGEGPADEMNGAPSPMLRTGRRLTQRKKSFKKLEDDEYIGFASLPEQVHRKAVRRGFEFTLMVVGETGLGKSTLINSLFLTDLYKDRKVGKIEERIQKTVELEKKELEIEEKGVKLKLTIVDTPGFSDAVNAEESWKPIVNYIDKQFESYFKAESGLNRKNIHDSRVHCCLYFISPYGHGLRPVDVLVMKKLHNKVNIVPLVAKSDMLTKKEIKALKEKVLTEIQKHKIQIYQFPDCDSDEDEDFKQQDQELKKAIPFAVVGSNTVVEAGGKKIRGRMYPWGIVEVENPSHCDFVKLRQMLISTHMQDLKDVTCDVHYENYRAEHISEQMTGQHRERGKLKRESVTNMDKVMDTERLLQEKEAEIKRMQEMLAKMQSQLNQNSPKLNGKVAAV